MVYRHWVFESAPCYSVPEGINTSEEGLGSCYPSGRPHNKHGKFDDRLLFDIRAYRNPAATIWQGPAAPENR